jgi:hypothetical protein
MSEDIDINIQYEQIFGHEERPNIFMPDDEEYLALRQEILASKSEIVKTKELPFSGVNIIPYAEYVRNNLIQLTESKGYHIFYLKVYKNANLEIYAAGYYDKSDNKFVVLQDSFCNDSDYFNELSRKQKKIYGKQSKSIIDAYTPAIAFINSFAIKGSKLVQNKAVRYDSASLAASYFLGCKTTFRVWKDANDQSLDNFYDKYRSSKIDASEDRTFPGYIEPEVKYVIGDIISTLSAMAGKPIVKRNRFVDINAYKSKHLFYLEKQDICKASGYYDKETDTFYLCRGSLVAIEESKSFQKLHASKSRARFINQSCDYENGYHRVIKDVKCKSATEAACYAMGDTASYTIWKDVNGKVLRDFYPDKFVIGDGEIKKVENAAETVPNEQRLFYIKRDTQQTRSCLAVGTYDKETETFTLQAGSLIALIAVPSYDMSAAGTSRARFIARYCAKEQNGYRLKKDHVFDSPSAAAAYVLGRMANGWLDWIDEAGNTLDSVFRKK